jgi:CHAT domain-containing protein
VIAHFDDRHGSGKSVDQIRPVGPHHTLVGRDKFYTFVKDTVNDVYRRVADLLLSQGRLAESEQLLRLLKQKEYHDFLPGEVKDAVSDVAPQTAYDQKWQERFNAIHDQLASIGREYGTLLKKEPRTDEENQRLAVLESDLATAQQALQQLYQDISAAGNPKMVRDLQVKALGNELYQIIFGPIAKNIESYQPKTLVWSLDDVLRYVPMAALYDGSHYLTERYANVVITLGSLINLKDKPSSEWTALGLGVSKAHQNWPGCRTFRRN